MTTNHMTLSWIAYRARALPGLPGQQAATLIACKRAYFAGAKAYMEAQRRIMEKNGHQAGEAMGDLEQLRRELVEFERSVAAGAA